MSRLASHLKRNAYGLIAVFIALGGTAYAAATIGPKDIKPDAVRSKHVKDGQIKNVDIDPAALQGLDAASLNGAILVSDQDSAGAGQSGAQSIGSMPGIGHFSVVCGDPTMSIQFVSESNVGPLAVIQDAGGLDAAYFEVGNGQSTTAHNTTAVDGTAEMITYRIHRGQQSAPEVETPKATVTVTMRRGTNTIPDLCNYTVQGIVQP